MATEPIKINGLSQFVNNLKKIDKDLPKTLRVGFNDAAQIIVDYARPRMPHRTGKAQKSVKVRSTSKEVRVTEGGKSAPYVPWLDFGGTIGKRSQKKRQAALNEAGNGGTARTGHTRPWIAEGRYLYAGLNDERDKIFAAVEGALLDAVEAAGIEVD